MLLEVYISELEASLANNPKKDEIVKDIKDKINLYQEASLSEEEIIKRLPKIDELIFNNEEVSSEFYLELNVAGCDEINIVKKMVKGVIINNLEEIKDKVDIIASDNKLVIKEKKKSFFFNRKNRYELDISVGQALNTLNIRGISSDLSLNGIDVSSCKINLVSGDLDISDSKFKNIEFVNVSGDIKLVDVNVDTGRISTVSGDIETDNLKVVTSLSCHTVSGDLDTKNMNDSNISFHSISGEFLRK